MIDSDCVDCCKFNLSSAADGTVLPTAAADCEDCSSCCGFISPRLLLPEGVGVRRFELSVFVTACAVVESHAGGAEGKLDGEPVSGCGNQRRWGKNSALK